MEREIKMQVLTECIVKGNRLGIVVLDEAAKTAAEAVWTDGRWDTDFSYPAIGVTVDEVAESMDYDAVREAGYTIID